MNKKFLFILPIILLTSCSDLTNNTSKFNLLDENKFYKVILYEDLYSSTGVESDGIGVAYYKISIILSYIHLNK